MIFIRNSFDFYGGDHLLIIIAMPHLHVYRVAFDESGRPVGAAVNNVCHKNEVPLLGNSEHYCVYQFDEDDVKTLSIIRCWSPWTTS